MNKTAIRRGRFLVFAIAVLLTFSLVVPIASCRNETDTGKPIVAVTLLPQAGFVKSIAGDKVEIMVMVPPGASPHTYEVKPSQMVLLSKASMYAKVGSPVEFELTWMDKLVDANREMLIVDCSKGIHLIGMDHEDHHGANGHDHNGGHHHDHKGLDPHIWLSIKNARIMAQNICDGLVQIDPANSDYYESNCLAYLEELEALDKEIAAGLADVQNRRFMVFHPAFGYFAHDYGLEQIAVEQGGKEPSAKYMTRLIDMAKDHDIRVVFVSPQHRKQDAQAIAQEIDGQVVIINPLAEDFTSNMRSIASAMIQAMQ